MSRPKISKQHAVFPPGYVVPFPVRALIFFARRSARMRAFLLGLPQSRVRTYFLACYAHWMYEEVSADRRDRVLDTMAEDSEWVIGDLETFRGRDGFWRALDDTFPGVQVELREYIDVGGGRFVCLHSFEGEGGASGISASGLGPGYPVQCVFTIRQGRVTRCQAFTTKSEALEAAGLSE